MSQPHSHVHPGLEVKVERTGPCQARVQFHVTAEELRKSREHELANLSKRVRLKGFRPGKAPRAMIEKQFGAEVDREVFEHFLNHAFETAVKEHSLRPAVYPRVDLAQSRPQAGQDWDQSFELLLRPELELGEIEGLEVERRPSSVSEEELEQTLGELARAHSRAEPAGDQGLGETGVAVARVAYFKAGETQPCLEREGIRISPKSPPPGVEKEVFEASVSGAREGEEREFDAVFPESFPVEEARGTRGRCRVTLTQVFRIVPPSDEELRAAFQVEDQEALRAAVRARIQKHKDEAEDQRLESELLERLLEAHPMELPEPLLEQQVQAHLEELQPALEGQGLGAEEVRTRLEEERPRARKSAERGLRAMYLIEEIAKAKKLQVTEQDLSAELVAIAQRNGTDVQEVGRYYKEQGLMRQLGLELLERKVRHFLREKAAIRGATA